MKEEEMQNNGLYGIGYAQIEANGESCKPSNAQRNKNHGTQVYCKNSRNTLVFHLNLNLSDHECPDDLELFPAPLAEHRLSPRVPVPRVQGL